MKYEFTIENIEDMRDENEIAFLTDITQKRIKIADDMHKVEKILDGLNREVLQCVCLRMIYEDKQIKIGEEL